MAKQSKRSKAEQYAQGDLLFVRVDKAPTNARSVKPVNGRLVLAEGEATGHAHVVDAKGASLVEAPNEGGVTYLTVEELTGGTVVKHDEHAGVKLGPGVWKVQRQREVTDDDENWSQVAD